MMKNMKYLLSGICVLSLLTACDSDMWSLQDDNKGAFVEIEGNPISTTLSEMEAYQEWVKVLNYSEEFSVLNALYDHSKAHQFTHLAPTNDAVLAFYAQRGVQGIEELGKDYAKAMVRNMTIDGDSLKLTEQFGSDVLRYEHFNEDDEQLAFIIDEESKEGGFRAIYLQDSVHLSRNYITCSNGFVYTAAGVLPPLVESIYRRLVEDGQNSIMLEALRATGYDKVLNTVADTTYVLGARKISQPKYTFLNVPDNGFKASGINSLSDLKNALVARADNSTVTADSLLKQYVEYHIVDGSYSADQFCETAGGDSVSIRNPKAPYQIIMTTRHDGGTLEDSTYYFFTVNDEDPSYVKPLLLKNVHGVEIGQHTQLYAFEHEIAKNGRLINVSDWMPVYEPNPTTLVWDLADYAEMRNYAAENNIVYQPLAVANSESMFNASKLGCYEVELGPEGAGNGNGYYQGVSYVTSKNNLKNCYHLDRIVINVGYMGSVSMKCPTLAKGKYKVTLGMAYTTNHSDMRQQKNCKGGMMRLSVDGKNEIVTAPYTTITSSQPNVYSAVLYDEIEFTETAPHTFKFLVLDPAATTSAKFSLEFDTITFTPIE